MVAPGNIGSYESRVRDFCWSIAEEELGIAGKNQVNIGYLCTDRNCRRGLGGKTAMYWENSNGQTKTYTFDQLRLATNTYAQLLKDLGVKPGDRVCLFMDRVPDLYIAFLGILKLGGIVQPLFSAFGEEALETRMADAETTAYCRCRLRHLHRRTLHQHHRCQQHRSGCLRHHRHLGRPLYYCQ